MRSRLNNLAIVRNLSTSLVQEHGAGQLIDFWTEFIYYSDEFMCLRKANSFKYLLGTFNKMTSNVPRLISSVRQG